jgi:hypothetical protein
LPITLSLITLSLINSHPTNFHTWFALSQVVNGCNIFARASPENKLRIVRALQTGPGYEGPMDGDDPDDDGRSNSSTYCMLCTFLCCFWGLD